MSTVTPIRPGSGPGSTAGDTKTEFGLRKPGFCVIVGSFDLPLAGAPKPRPCPFCDSECIAVVLDRRDDGTPGAHVECKCCGTESCWTEEGRMGYDVALDAARKWNKRVKKR